MNLRISVDTGGTCTDVVVTDGEGRLVIGKALTTPKRIFEGFAAALETAVAQLGLGLPDALAQSELLIYGTTHATNAALVGDTARTALLVTRGFRDTLVLREGGRPNAFDFGREYPVAYVPRSLTFEVSGRMSSEGEELAPFLEAEVRNTARMLVARSVEAVAVCLLWSVANPAHELAVGRILDEELDGVPYTLSHKLNPVVREYRRASSAAIDASLKPVMQAHLEGLAADLGKAGFNGELLVVTSLGGSMHLEEVVERPIYLVKSGPSMAPVAASTYGEQEAIGNDLLVCDTGGTSFDVSIVRDRRIAETRDTWLGDPLMGHMTGLSSVDVRSIGAGGGSLAWIDDGGLLRVGPQSAGADPGPVCYGLGGTEPAVTDAAAILGYIDPETFLGGRIALEVEAARAATQPLADELDLSVEEAAWAILAVANDHMVSAISAITINEGIDPRDATIVAGGGAAGMNIIPIAGELGTTQVLIPRTAGVLSACGGQYADVVMDVTRSKFTTSAEFDFDEINAVLEGLDAELDVLEERLSERGLTSFGRSYGCEARYLFQIWELDVELDSNRLVDGADLDGLMDTFHDLHEKLFSVKELGQTIEFLTWRARLRADLGAQVTQPGVSTNGSEHPAPRVTRPAYFPRRGVIETPRYTGESMRPGTVIEGPAVIEEPTTTLVIYPGSTLTTTPSDNYLITIEPGAVR
jgi:N-methylhydantoinase A